MNSLLPKENLEKIKYVGFDMDGTLYDEFQFISQVYKPISDYLSYCISKSADEIYSVLLKRWKEKGSSYPFIFDEVLRSAVDNEGKRREAVSNCLNIYRTYQPKLKLAAYVKETLDELASKYSLFLITDGNYELQRSKFADLSLNIWFDEENCFFTGLYGKEFYKPSNNILEKIPIFQNTNNPYEEVLFFGDRDVDCEFAKNANIQFVKVYEMRRC